MIQTQEYKWLCVRKKFYILRIIGCGSSKVYCRVQSTILLCSYCHTLLQLKRKVLPFMDFLCFQSYISVFKWFFYSSTERIARAGPLLKYNYRFMASNLLTNYPKRLEETDEL